MRRRIDNADGEENGNENAKKVDDGQSDIATSSADGDDYTEIATEVAEKGTNTNGKVNEGFETEPSEIAKPSAGADKKPSPPPSYKEFDVEDSGRQPPKEQGHLGWGKRIYTWSGSRTITSSPVQLPY